MRKRGRECWRESKREEEGGESEDGGVGGGLKRKSNAPSLLPSLSLPPSLT